MATQRTILPRSISETQRSEKFMRARRTCSFRRSPNFFFDRNRRMTRSTVYVLAAIGLATLMTSACRSQTASSTSPQLWQIYDQSLKSAKYVDLTHTIAPGIPVWKGFGPAKFSGAVDPKTGVAYQYSK